MLFILPLSPVVTRWRVEMRLKPFSSLSDATVEVLDVRVYMVYTIAVSTVKQRKEKKKSRLGPHSSSLDATLVVVAISEAYLLKK